MDMEGAGVSGLGLGITHVDTTLKTT